VELSALATRLSLAHLFLMSVKEQVLASLNELPEQATWEDVGERVQFLAALDEARAQLDRGEGIPHEQVKQEVLSWLRA
jgi:hypothetical protein